MNPNEGWRANKLYVDTKEGGQMKPENLRRNTRKTESGEIWITTSKDSLNSFVSNRSLIQYLEVILFFMVYQESFKELDSGKIHNENLLNESSN